jgi:hypothetical protein
MEWGQFQQLALLTRFSEKFEITQMDLYLIFYEFWKLADLIKMIYWFPKKMASGWICQIWADPAHTSPTPATHAREGAV